MSQKIVDNGLWKQNKILQFEIINFSMKLSYKAFELTDTAFTVYENCLIPINNRCFFMHIYNIFMKSSGYKFRKFKCISTTFERCFRNNLTFTKFIDYKMYTSLKFLHLEFIYILKLIFKRTNVTYVVGNWILLMCFVLLFLLEN